MVGEMFGRENVLVGKRLVGEVSIGEVPSREIVRSEKCQSGICFSRETVRSGNCPTLESHSKMR